MCGRARLKALFACVTARLEPISRVLPPMLSTEAPSRVSSTILVNVASWVSSPDRSARAWPAKRLSHSSIVSCFCLRNGSESGSPLAATELARTMDSAFSSVPSYD